MMKRSFFLFLLMITACNARKINNGSYSGSVNTQGYQADTLPPPYATGSAKNYSSVVGWKEGKVPLAPAGFTVTKFADGLDHPRWIYVAANGDIFVAESNTLLKGIKKLGAKLSRKIKTQHYGESANRIIMFRDADKNGIPESRHVLLENLNQPFGMLILGKYFYVGNTDALLRFPYQCGDTVIRGKGEQILSLPAGKYNRHWTRNIITNARGDKIFIAVGSGTNVAEKGLDNEKKRANILEVNPDGSGERIYASGLRNPVGMDWSPVTGSLWTAVNERDELGDELVPDYLTQVKEGGFYGWPFYYYGNHAEPRMKDKMAAAPGQQAITPDLPLGSHTASLGLLFYKKNAFPAKYHNGAFITQHGSWNRSVLSGYKVVFVPFRDGKPAGGAEDFLTGFMDDLEKSEVRGRPVGIAVLADGSMLVSDDASNIIWRVRYEK
ncbi:sorbosone dehydrogenase family protein [Chitinophaga sp. MM2321]|uniref:PQQ-dependent sugar dehydrogenase n=1 Tax=Chitinophaga sp. MM2321 TaxID=3137178 RepID=UPI0032D59476